jgi:hydroxylamine reductase
LVCGSDIKALKELLEQSQEKGVDIYTTSEMVAAHAYPEIRKFSHLAGNYGGSWSSQREVFPAFHGPILFASGSLIPPSLEFSYKERIFTTNVNGCPGCRHIGEDSQGKRDFSELIECAKEYRAPASLERGCINVGMSYNSLKYVSSSILNALNTKDITHLTVIVGSDGRSAMWDFYEKVAKSCPISSLVLCAGDIKYRFNKERFGYVNGIPRLIDAGQINDIFSIIELLLDMKNTLHVNDINKLPVSFYASMHDPRSMATLLALISLGIKGIRVGPLNAPPFCTEKMLKWLNTPKYSSSQIAYP